MTAQVVSANGISGALRIRVVDMPEKNKIKRICGFLNGHRIRKSHQSCSLLLVNGHRIRKSYNPVLYCWSKAVKNAATRSVITPSRAWPSSAVDAVGLSV